MPFYLSVVTPVFNEQECLREFHSRVSKAVDSLGCRAEFIFINDGSSDDSASVLTSLRASDKRVKVLSFSRNFGHQLAIKAGLDSASGDAVVILDADLQDPPEEIPRLVSAWREGCDVVYAVRESREGESWFKRSSAALFYRLLRSIAQLDIPPDAGDFRLLSRPVVDALKEIREREPYMRGLTHWIGFRQQGVPVRRQARFAGATKYPLKKMFKLAWNGISHFSFLPLQVSTWLGLLTAVVCLAWMAQALYARLVLHDAVPGWTSLMLAVLFLGAVQLITLGVLGSYVGRIYDETRRRPLYVVSEKQGF